MSGTDVVHCKKAPFDVYIGRPSKWGNPYSIGPDGTREEVIEKYRLLPDDDKGVVVGNVGPSVLADNRCPYRPTVGVVGAAGQDIDDIAS